MNAIVIGITPALPLEPFVAATAQVNEWRGRCMDVFTRAEASVTECLALLSQVDGRGQQVTLPHLLGQRLEALSAALGPGGPFEKDAGKARATLDQYRSHADFRNMLCHGVSKITLDPKARWTVVLRLVSLRSKQVVRESLALTQDEAEELRMKIVRVSQDLGSQLGQINARLRK